MPEYDGPGRRAGSRTGDVRQTPGKPAARRTVRRSPPELSWQSCVAPANRLSTSSGLSKPVLFCSPDRGYTSIHLVPSRASALSSLHALVDSAFGRSRHATCTASAPEACLLIRHLLTACVPRRRAALRAASECQPMAASRAPAAQAAATPMVCVCYMIALDLLINFHVLAML